MKKNDQLNDLWALAALAGVSMLTLLTVCNLNKEKWTSQSEEINISNMDFNKNETTDHIEDILKTIQTDIEVDAIETFEDLNAYFDSGILFHTEVNEIDDYCERILWIEVKEEKGVSFEISDKVYQKINMLMDQYQCNHLVLHHIGNEIDFSKLNISNIPWLTIDDLQNGFDYTDLPTSTYERLDLRMPLNDAFENWLLKLDLHQTRLNLMDYNRLDTEYSLTDISYLEFFRNENIDLSESILEVGIVDPCLDDLKLLEQIHARQIYFSYYFFQSPPNFDAINFHLNPTIECLFIDFANIMNSQDCTLGHIEVNSSNPNLLVGFRGSLDCPLHITEETKLELPDTATLALHNCHATSDQFLDSLTNIHQIIGLLHIQDSFVNMAYQKDGNRTLDDIKQEIMEAVGYQYTK